MEKIKEVNMQIFITNETRKNLRCKTATQFTQQT